MSTCVNPTVWSCLDNKNFKTNIGMGFISCKT